MVNFLVTQWYLLCFRPLFRGPVGYSAPLKPFKILFKLLYGRLLDALYTITHIFFSWPLRRDSDKSGGWRDDSSSLGRRLFNIQAVVLKPWPCARRFFSLFFPPRRLKAFLLGVLVALFSALLSLMLNGSSAPAEEKHPNYTLLRAPHL